MKNDETTTLSGEQRKTRRYNVSQVGHSLDTAMASEMQPLDAMVHDLRDKFLTGLARGYSISDLVLMVQEAGVDATDRQIRYAFTKAGIRRKRQKSSSARGGFKAPSGQQNAGGANDEAASPAQVTDASEPASDADDDAESTEHEDGDAMDGVQPIHVSGIADLQMRSSGTMNGTQAGVNRDGMFAGNAGQHGGSVDDNYVQPGQKSDASDTPAGASEDKGGAQSGAVSGVAGPQDEPSANGNTAQAGAQDQQTRRPAWTPHPGALQHVFGNADTTKINRYKNLNERRGRK